MSADRPENRLIDSLGDFIAAHLIRKLSEPKQRFAETVQAGAAEPDSASRPHKPIEKRLPAHSKLMRHAPPFSKPIKTAALIRAAGYSVNSWSRERVTELVDAGELVRHSRNKGVSLPPGNRAAG